ncbi:hypothetical protein JRQ81_017383, partial [Phrynocephalus forsythii]
SNTDFVENLIKSQFFHIGQGSSMSWAQGRQTFRISGLTSFQTKRAKNRRNTAWCWPCLMFHRQQCCKRLRYFMKNMEVLIQAKVLLKQIAEVLRRLLVEP